MAAATGHNWTVPAMPTYEYVCPKCGHAFELFQSMNDAPLKKCPKCHKLGVKRLVGGGAGLIFKGSGFYITDYKKKSGTPDAVAKPAAAGADKKPAAPAAATK
jgi:putative FmdB family regulatory protein